jgi:hypothetical protein
MTKNVMSGWAAAQGVMVRRAQRTFVMMMGPRGRRLLMLLLLLVQNGRVRHGATRRRSLCWHRPLLMLFILILESGEGIGTNSLGGALLKRRDLT